MGAMLTRVKMFGVVLPAFALALVIALGGGRATAAADKNKCGCYRDSGGTCYCDKKAKCGCPGECEPKGCEEAREKEIQKEIDAETKKAADRERSSKASSEKEKPSADAESGDNESDSGDKKAGTEVAPAAGKKLTVAQTKQLAKLIDAYLAAHPGNGGKSISDVRSELK
jgi:hypothetical protein